MQKSLNNWAAGIANDAERKACGQAARLGKETILWDVISAIFTRFKASTLTQASVNPDAPKDHALYTMAGMQAMFNGIEELIAEEASIIAKEQEVKDESKTENVDAYGESIATSTLNNVI